MSCDSRRGISRDREPQKDKVPNYQDSFLGKAADHLFTLWQVTLVELVQYFCMTSMVMSSVPIIYELLHLSFDSLSWVSHTQARLFDHPNLRFCERSSHFGVHDGY